ncbi:cysteine desulfurase, SufS subfamily [Gleimia coleocanis DSM 15436]|uniref:Cysteine desulfurase n=1 Tax=Gleimia coleocanis DSM 15436 TaxID=525245 RepID=C0VZ95_9ACTO|nr:SufS family cysteine desulfurase [Gleimia coleocanis]EEH64196.1 cysteine desulfurase, SufS subfamily [Gleimia coleocanis DSM 15436]
MTVAQPTPLTDAELSQLREQFPILSRTGRDGQAIAYLDSAATAQKPQRVIDTEKRFYELSNAAVNRGTHELGDEATQAFDDARTTVSAFIGGQTDELVWTKNATEGLNLIAYAMQNASLDKTYAGNAQTECFRIGPGDRIVTTRAEHHANLLPWQELCKRTGAEFAYLDLTPEGRIDLETLSVITPNTKLVAFTHMSNVTGAISPVAEIVAAARAVGALVVLDTCQSAAHMPVDVRALDVDFAVMSSHKMCGPTGVGALWGRAELLDAMPPVLSGGSMIATVSMEGARYLPAPHRFEAGSQPVAQAVAWAEAVEFLKTVGMDRVAATEEILAEAMVAEIAAVPGLRILGPETAENRAAVVSFAVDGVHPHDVGQFLDASSIAVRVGHHCAIPLHTFFGVRSSTRASAGLTTTVEEVQRLGAALSGVQKFFGGY